MNAVHLSPIILIDLNKPWERALPLGLPVNFSPKQLLLSDPDNDNFGFYYIRKGRVRLSHISAGGQEKVLFYLGKGTLCCDIPVLCNAAECIFTCMEPTNAVFFSKKLIGATFAQEYPDLMLNWIESSAKKSSNFFQQLCGSGLRDVYGNVCRVLYSMVLYNKENGKIVPHLTRQEIASLLGIHRGSLHKALTRLKKEGIIADYSRHNLVVLDLEKLKEHALD